MKTNKNIKTIRRSNKWLQALELPVLANVNPRSAYNKADELRTFIDQEQVDILFLSESWEKENFKLEELLHLENHTVVSNVYQRNGKGGRPALVINNHK